MKNLIKVERARHNLTQAQLADKLSVSRLTIHAIENNIRKHFFSLFQAIVNH